VEFVDCDLAAVMASRLGYRLALRLYSTAAANRFNGRVAIVTGGASGEASKANTSCSQ
jgi:hypothetical protein